MVNRWSCLKAPFPKGWKRGFYQSAALVFSLSSDDINETGRAGVKVEIACLSAFTINDNRKIIKPFHQTT
jgi:hypothetical protein